MSTLSVVMPAFNEGEHIYDNLHRVCQSLASVPFEIVVVDDGSGDSTFDECQRARADGLPVRVDRRPANEGKGAALAHGFGLTTGQLVAFLDSDLEIGPEYVRPMIECLQDRGADVVIGVRERPRNGFPLARRTLSRAYRWLVAWLLGLPVRETQTGLKLFRREVLEACVPRLAARRFAFDVELLAASHRFGYLIVEFPVRSEYRRRGRLGRMTPWQLLGMLAETLAVYYRASFWKWLQPGVITKGWMIALAAGIFLTGVGVAKLVTPLALHGPARELFYWVALQFLPRHVRDWLLVVVGIALATVSLVQLNKSLMGAFARLDRGDLAGILRRPHPADRSPQQAGEGDAGAAEEDVTAAGGGS